MTGPTLVNILESEANALGGGDYDCYCHECKEANLRANRMLEAAKRLREIMAEADERAKLAHSRGRTKALMERVNNGTW